MGEESARLGLDLLSHLVRLPPDTGYKLAYLIDDPAIRGASIEHNLLPVAVGVGKRRQGVFKIGAQAYDPLIK